MANDLQTNLDIIDDFTQRLQVAVIGAEETTAKHEHWVEGTSSEVIQTVNGPIKTLRGLIADWDALFQASFDSTIEGYDSQFADKLDSFDNDFLNYLLNIGFESAEIYQGGITIERRSQTVAYDGVTYYWAGTLPFVTTGVFTNEADWLIAPIVGGIEIPQITFATGGNLVRKTQSVLGTDGEWYFWTGSFPKTIPVASTLDSAGGVGLNKFKLASGHVPVRPMMKILSTAAGFVLNSGSFEYGATITSSSQVLPELNTGRIWKWDGPIPKVVDLNSSPASSGGVGENLWNEVVTATGSSGSGITIGATKPTGVGSGHRWFCTTDGRTYIYFADGDSVQWVEESPQNSVFDGLEPRVRESLRRSYAEAGYNLVAGSFEAGGTLVNANDVLLQERTGKAFSGPAGTYPAGTPTSGFVDESGKTATRKITTVAEIATGKWPVGTQLEVKGRGGAHFEVLAGGTPNGFDILDAGNGNTAVLVFTDATTAVSYGLSSTRSDNQVPIQAMIDHVGYFKLPRGSFDINDEILHKGAARSLGSVWSGAGKESSVLNCVGMSGKSGIRTSADHYVRVEFKDFTIRGDVDHAINLNQATKETYQTKFTRLWLSANLDTCKVSTPFSVEFDGVDASSENGHCFSTRGGNTVLFKSCYAHGVGEGMAGYRVQGKATLINCNGIEEVTGNKYWGWFGDKVNNFAYQITTINCNAEDFGTDGAIRCENFGILVLNGQTFVARSSGTYDNLVNFETLSGNNRIYIDAQTSFASKGAAISGNAGIKANGLKFGLNLSGSPVFQNYYNSQVSILYPMPTIDMKGSEFGVSSLGVNNFDASANYSFETPVVATWTANAATYDGTGKQVIKTVNTVATSITNCTGLREGTELKILIKDANTTIKHLTGGSGKFRMLSGADVVAANGAVYMFVANGAEWVQV